MSLKSRESHLRRTYGITLEQYDDLLKKQKGCCPVCERHHTEIKGSLCVDHNHKTGEIRGLLCTYCNRYRVGHHTDSELVARIARYLKKGTGWYVPKKKPRKRRRKKH